MIRNLKTCLDCLGKGCPTCDYQGCIRVVKDIVFESPNGLKDTLSNVIAEVMQKQSEHLEKFAAAFLKEVGSAEASKYQLVQQMKGDKVSWWFEKK